MTFESGLSANVLLFCSSNEMIYYTIPMKNINELANDCQLPLPSAKLTLILFEGALAVCVDS